MVREGFPEMLELRHRLTEAPGHTDGSGEGASGRTDGVNPLLTDPSSGYRVNIMETQLGQPHKSFYFLQVTCGGVMNRIKIF